MSFRDVIIIGGGPSGLAAAIAAKVHGLDYQVLEQGVLVNSIYRFPPQMVFFTTPELLEIGGLPFVSPYDKPTRPEALRYYRRVVDTYGLQIAFDERAMAITSGGDHVFAVETRSSKDARRLHRGRNVIFAIGYYDHPVMLDVPGEALPHVHHYYSDPHVHYRQRVVVVGGGNSAAEWALELFRAGAHATVIHRRAELKSTIKYWVRPDIENRIKEGSITARFNAHVKEIRESSVVLTTPSELDGSGGSSGSGRAGGAREEEIPADAVYLLTGYRADSSLMCRAGVRLNEREAPVHDPETFETNVPGLYIAGGAIAGVDTGTIFIENGRFHGEKIIDVIRRRLRPSPDAQ